MFAGIVAHDPNSRVKGIVRMKQQFQDMYQGQWQTYQRLKEVIGDEPAWAIATAGFTDKKKKGFMQFIETIETAGTL